MKTWFLNNPTPRSPSFLSLSLSLSHTHTLSLSPYLSLSLSLTPLLSLSLFHHFFLVKDPADELKKRFPSAPEPIIKAVILAGTGFVSCQLLFFKMSRPIYSLVQWNWFSDVTHACNSGASSDHRDPISLHQAVLSQPYILSRFHVWHDLYTFQSALFGRCFLLLFWFTRMQDLFQTLWKRKNGLRGPFIHNQMV